MILFSEVEFLGLRPVKLIPAPWGDRYVVVSGFVIPARFSGEIPENSVPPWDGSEFFV